MANEVQMSVVLAAAKNGAAIQASHQVITDMAGEDMINATQLIGTSAETLVLGELASAGTLLVKNMDSTNFVELALDSGMTNKFEKLLAGAVCLLHPSTTTIYAKADTASCRVQVVAVEL